MTAAAWVCLAFAAGFAAANWYAVLTARSWLEYVAKPGTLAMLVLVAVLLDPSHCDMRAWFVVALVLSLAGDMFLMLPQDLFVPGLASFLLAHVAYVVGFALHSPGEPAPVVTTALVVAAAVVLGAHLVRALIARGERALVGPVAAYVVVIAVMVSMALASDSWFAAIGALLFMGSDALIGETRFVRPRSWAPVAIIATYHLGQAGLVLSLAR